MNLILMKRVSLKEAEKGMLFIQPQKLKEFPQGKEFKIQTPKGDETVKIFEVQCNCSDSPSEHKHQYLPLKNHKLSKGSVVLIKKDGDKFAIE